MHGSLVTRRAGCDTGDTMADCHALAKQPLASVTFSPRPSECPVIRMQCHDKDPLDKICTLTSLATSAQSLVINKSQPCSGAVIPFAQKPIPFFELAAPLFKTHWNLPPKRASVDCHAVLLPLHISQNAAEVSRGSEWSTAPYPYGSWL